jgi:predicted MFS family arabinose efflux permease
MAWIIIGHIVSVFFKRKSSRTLVLLTILFGVCVLFFPSFLRTHETYKFVKLYSLWLWVILWAIVNILEARYFHLIWDDHEKEYWSAAYGIVTNIIMFGTMIWTSSIEKHYNIRFTFTFFGIAILFSAIGIRKLK